MKKIFSAIAVTCIFIQSINACEICGCGTGNYYLGLVPGFHHHFFGVRYQFRNFKTILSNDPNQFSNDYYKSIEFWGGININKKLQLIGIIPVNNLHQISDDGITNKTGIGDAAVLLNYNLFDKFLKRGNKKISQQLWIGGGIKLPTGKFNVDINDPEIIALANTQTGSGSADFMLNTTYNLNINSFGLNTNIGYKINTANKDKYEFGNKFSSSLLAYYNIKNNKIIFTPNIGLSYEQTATNKLQSKIINQTGGYISLATAGLEIGFKKITIGCNVQLPIAQNFANGQTSTKIKAMMHVSFSF